MTKNEIRKHREQTFYYEGECSANEFIDVECCKFAGFPKGDYVNHDNDVVCKGTQFMAFHIDRRKLYPTEKMLLKAIQEKCCKNIQSTKDAMAAYKKHSQSLVSDYTTMKKECERKLKG